MRRYATIGILLIVLAYPVSLLTWGRQTLASQVIKTTNGTYARYRWTKQVRVVTNLPSEHFSKYFFEMDPSLLFSSVTTGKTEEGIGNERNVYYYVVIASNRYWPFVTIEESEKIEEYAAVWQRQYIWGFLRWVEISNESIGIS